MDRGSLRPNRLWIGATALVVAVAAVVLWTGVLGPNQEKESQQTGQVHIASVENNHTERVEVAVFTVTDTEAKVDGNASTVLPGTEEDFGLLDCRDGEFVADRLRVLVSTDGEPGYEIELLVGLEDGECRTATESAFMIAVDAAESLAIQRAGD